MSRHFFPPFFPLPVLISSLCFFPAFSSLTSFLQERYKVLGEKTRKMVVEVKGWFC